MKIVLTLIILGCLLASFLPAGEIPAVVVEQQQARIESIEKASRSFVAIFDQGGKGGGSGVVISADGLAVTNFHVAKPSGNHMKCGMNDGKLYDAILVGLDPTGDIALIQLQGRKDFTPATIADSDAVLPGHECFAVGNPFLLAQDFQPTVTYGLVSGVHRCQYPAGTLLEYTDAIQTDASINPGNSGGPLFNAAGDLIGIIGSGSFDKRGRVNVGVGYAISINQVKNFLGCLQAGRVVDHATLGATVATNDQGVVFVRDILETSDAYRRGLRYDDQIIAFGGKRVTSANGFKSILGTFPKGWVVPLTYRRDNRDTTIQVRLTGLLTVEELHKKATQAFGEVKPPAIPIPKIPGTKPKSDPHEIETPNEIAKLIEPRRGFANYYFNRQHKQAIWNNLQRTTKQWPTENWEVSGVMGEHSFTMELKNEQSTGKFATGLITVNNMQDFDEQLAPEETGGLLAACHLFRLFMVQGTDKFGEVYAYGTRPLTLGEQQHPVLIATRNVAEMHLVCHAETGRPLRFEFFGEQNADPCELRFVEWNAEGASPWPKQIEVWHAEKKVAVIDSITAAKGESQP